MSGYGVGWPEYRGLPISISPPSISY